VPDLAFHNGGGIRGNQDQAAGPITEADTFRIAAFSNFVSIAPRYTGAAAQGPARDRGQVAAGTGDGAFVQIAGARYTVDPSRQAQTFVGDTREILQPGDRIRELVLDDGTVIVQDGVVLEPGRTFAVASNDFSLAGGDRYPQVEFVRLGVQYQQGLVSYLRDDLGGVVTEAQYPRGGEGRITIIR
jgi:5'-nucleotidase